MWKSSPEYYSGESGGWMPIPNADWWMETEWLLLRLGGFMWIRDSFIGSHFPSCVNSAPSNRSLKATVWHRSLVQVLFVLRTDFGADGRTCTMCRWGTTFSVVRTLSNISYRNNYHTICSPVQHAALTERHPPFTHLSPTHTHTPQRMKTR